VVAFVEDLSAFFELKADGGLADPATLQGGAAVNVIFDAEYLTELGMAGTNPAALAKAADVSAANIGQTLTINAIVYTIRNRRQIDDGATVLLELQGP